MNYSMVKLLILKDWYLQRWMILGSLVAGALALAITVSSGKAAFFLGIILLVTILVAVGAQLAIATVVNERKEQTLAFVMSMPISSREYTTAKILANLLIFLVPWIAVLLGCVSVILALTGIPHGLVPYVSIMCTEILVSNCLVFCVAIMTESQGWAIAAIMVGNITFNAVGYFVAHIPSIAAAMNGTNIIWNNAAVVLLSTELALVVLLLTLTFFVQSRKTDFI
jgi:ABC-2 type transport system permease protein